MPTPGRGDPNWGEVLQLPNLASVAQTDPYSVWSQRRASMASAQQTAMQQLADALKAERDAKMAALIARSSGGGGGRGRGGGGGGSKSKAGVPYVDVPQVSPWDMPMPSIAPAPSFDTSLYPSSTHGPNSVYAIGAPRTSTQVTSGGPGFNPWTSTRITSGGPGFKPTPPKSMTRSKYKAVLS